MHLYRQLPLVSFFSLCYAILLIINAGTVDFAGAAAIGGNARLFIINAWLGYNLMYLAPALLLTWLAGRKVLGGSGSRTQLIVAILTGGLTILFFYANARLHELYGMFVNGFVINLITTPGGLESLGGSSASTIGFVLVALCSMLAAALMMAGLRYAARHHLIRIRNFRKFAWGVTLVFLLSTVADRLTYAYHSALGNPEIPTLTEGIPFYVGTSARSLFKKMGYKVAQQDKGVNIKGRLRYPLHPIQAKPPAKPYNIVWLVSESWRADTLDQEIMPATWAFAQKAQHFTQHYSGGNGTRVGIFTMLTGVPGNYWHRFLETRRSAPIMDLLQQQGYQISLYTSAKFSYPEFDQTVFSKIPPAQMHWLETGAGWERDRHNVSDLLEFIKQRDVAKPFFTFMFFESPHARYYFPPESVIRKPYRDDINYATLSKEELSANISLIKNRYLNSVHHLDSQFARVLDYLASANLLENTLVVITGDHGEEFLENGYWGHNSTFSDPQTRTPLVLWIPGKPAATYSKLTSHLDITPTLMPLLGVTNPAEDYSIGHDLMGKFERDNVIIGDWSRVGYKDKNVKISLAMSAQGGMGRKVSGPNDETLTSEQARDLFQKSQSNLVKMMQELGRFNSK